MIFWPDFLLRPLSRKSSTIPTFPSCSAKDGKQKSPRCRCRERKLCIEAGCTDARLLLCACLYAADCVSIWVWTKHSTRKLRLSPKDDPLWVQKHLLLSFSCRMQYRMHASLFILLLLFHSERVFDSSLKLVLRFRVGFNPCVVLFLVLVRLAVLGKHRCRALEDKKCPFLSVLGFSFTSLAENWLPLGRFCSFSQCENFKLMLTLVGLLLLIRQYLRWQARWTRVGGSIFFFQWTQNLASVLPLR